jgi:hypothetical protein
VEDSAESLADLAGHQGDYNNCVAVSRWDPDIVAFGFNNTLLSFNGGDSWLPQGIDEGTHLHPDIHGLAFTDRFPGARQELFVASDGGIAGITWSDGPWMIESDHASDGIHGDLEVFVLEGNTIAQYTKPSGSTYFQRTAEVTDRATGSACFIASDFWTGGRRNYDAVVLEGTALVHYWTDNSTSPPTWVREQGISTNATGPSCIIQATS